MTEYFKYLKERFKYRLTMFVNMEESHMNRGIMGRRLHAFVMKAIQATDEILAQMIQERQVFSIHPIADPGEIRV